MCSVKAVAEMPSVDIRLLECDGEPEVTENFNRLLVLIDALEERIEALEAPAGT